MRSGNNFGHLNRLTAKMNVNAVRNTREDYCNGCCLSYSFNINLIANTSQS